VSLLNTDIQADVDSEGTFTLQNVPAGNYTLQVDLDHELYKSATKQISTMSEAALNLMPITLQYTGLPIIQNITAAYDSLHGIVALDWDAVADNRVNDYVVYRRVYKSGSVAALSPVKMYVLSNPFRDTLFAVGGGPGTLSFSDTTNYTVVYQVAVNSAENEVGPFFYDTQITVKTPMYYIATVSYVYKRNRDGARDTGDISFHVGDSLRAIVRIESQYHPIQRIVYSGYPSDTLLASHIFEQSIDSFIDTLDCRWYMPGIQGFKIALFDSLGRRMFSSDSLLTVAIKAFDINGNFESGDGTLPAYWDDHFVYQYPGGSGNAEFLWKYGEGVGNSRALILSHPTYNASGYNYNLDLDPYCSYRISGWIRGENILPQNNALPSGARIAYNKFDHFRHVLPQTDSHEGSFDWTYVSFDFQTDDYVKSNIELSLGHRYEYVKGTVYFDNLSLEALPPDSFQENTRYFFFDAQQYDHEQFSPPVLRNGDFEHQVGSLPAAWNTQGWIEYESDFYWTADEGMDTSAAVKIVHPDDKPNDTRWVQELWLQPHTTYTLTGYIRGDSVVNVEGGTYGANFSVDIPGLPLDWVNDISTPHPVGTFDWTPVSMEFTTDATGLVYIFARLGFFSNKCVGTVWFDNVELKIKE